MVLTVEVGRGLQSPPRMELCGFDSEIVAQRSLRQTGVGSRSRVRNGFEWTVGENGVQIDLTGFGNGVGSSSGWKNWEILGGCRMGCNFRLECTPI